MIKPQRKVDQEAGDRLCFSACIASLLGLELKDVPCFWIDDENGNPANDADPKAQEWLRQQGYIHIDFKWDSKDLGSQHGECLVILSGKSPRGVMHSTVGRFFCTEEGYHAVEMVHDPHPSRAGIREPELVTFLLPVDFKYLPQRNEETPHLNCCGEPKPDHPDSDLCPKCKQHCEIENGGE